MQNIIFYVAANETLGVVKDYANAKTVAPPTLVRGVEACLRMRLFANRDGDAPYPLTAFTNIVGWQWAMDSDFNEDTAYKLVGDDADISVTGVTEDIGGEEIAYTEIAIPMSGMNTAELAAWLGTEKSKSGLAGELVGVDANGNQVFILQVENFTVRNRITSLGNPTSLTPEYLTAAQVTAMIAAGVTLQFSVDGVDWHETQADADRFIRFRSASGSGAPWSEPLKMAAGPKGDPGVDAFCYIAYASDATGADFSFTPDNSLKYRSELHSPVELSPTAEDFTVWVKYIGDDGQGVGDMLASVYDTDGDGKVNSSVSADQAAAVPWGGISGKPASFSPSAHTHSMADIANPVYQKEHSAANPKTLYLDSPILRNTTVNASTDLAIDFTSVLTAPGGTAYSGVAGCLLTWEYHVTCSQEVTGVLVGSPESSMAGIDIPETLPLKNNVPTVHVFAIRGIYRSGAVNNLRLQVNYAYGYEA